MVGYHKVFDKLEELTDLETAVLLCLVAGEHCIIDTERSAIDELESELKLAAANTFGLSCVTISCSAQLSAEKFSDAILAQDRSRPPRGRVSSSILNETIRNPGSSHFHDSSPRRKSLSSSAAQRSDKAKIANVVIAKDLDQAPEDAQLQALELLHSTHNVPNIFIFVALLSAEGKPLSTALNKNLNDHIFLSHYHDPSDGFANLEESSEWFSDAQSYISRGTRKSGSLSAAASHSSLIEAEDIHSLRGLVDTITMSPDISCYIQNIVIFLRLNRAVFRGISATATRHFKLLARCLAPFQQMDYVCPSLVVAAARKVYRHRIVIPRPEDDRSMLYGSTLKAVEILLSDATPENTIECVLAEVEVPL